MELTIMNFPTDQTQVEVFRNHLLKHRLLDEENNLNLEKSSDRDFLEMFFALKIYNNKKTLSNHTLRAYQLDLKTLLDFLSANHLNLKMIGFAEVKIYNEHIRSRYANRSAVRKLDFFRRILEFGYITHFYKVQLAPWITKPSISRGHYNDRKEDETEKNRTQYRELSEEDAREIVSFFPEVVRSKKHVEQYKKRNELIGRLLFSTGLRASELIELNWGSFRVERRGQMIADVIGKGNKERTVPIFENVKEAIFDYRKIMNDSTTIDLDDLSPLFYRIDKYYENGIKCRITYDTLYKLVKCVVKHAEKNPRISPHWFRHTFITMSLERDVPLAIVRQVVGHADISTTNLYLERIKDDKLFDAFSNAGF